MATHVDSSAIVKLAVRKPESAALRRYLRGRNALSRAEVLRALLPAGEEAVARGLTVLRRFEFVRINDRGARPSQGSAMSGRLDQAA